jgi:hypothetical protein
MKMRMKMALGILVCLSLGLFLQPAYADDAPASIAPSAAMPEGEAKLIDIFTATAKQYKASRGADRAPETRENLQISLLRFMRQNPQAQDWTGTVKNRGLTPEGDAWISIEIADGITVSTLKSKAEDSTASTLIHPGSPLFAVAQNAKLGGAVKFSGQFLSSVIADDEEMILRPQLIMLFMSIDGGRG